MSYNIRACKGSAHSSCSIFSRSELIWQCWRTCCFGSTETRLKPSSHYTTLHVGRSLCCSDYMTWLPVFKSLWCSHYVTLCKWSATRGFTLHELTTTVTQQLYAVPKPRFVMKTHARIGTVVKGKWSLVKHWGFPLTVSGKDSKLCVCCKQHHLVVTSHASHDTWHHVMSSRLTGPDIWHARYLFGICEVSATRQRASLMHRCVVHTQRLRSSDHPLIFPRLQPDLSASSLTCKSGLKSCSVN